MRSSSYKTKVNQKRGYGEGLNYKPWLRVSDFSGKGFDGRIRGLKFGRIHQLFSKKEMEIFYIFDLNPEIQEIREQFPLLDFELAQEIAEEAGIDYPSGENNSPHVLTTDLFVIYKSGKRIAYTFKYLEAMSKTKRQLELFEIERRYWQKQGIEFFIITEKHIPPRDVRIAYGDLHACCRENNFELLHVQNVYSYLLQEYNSSSDKNIISMSKEMDELFNYSKGSSLKVVKFLIARRIITTNLEIPIHSTDKTISQFKFNFEHASIISESDLAA